MVLISQNAPHSVKRCSENDIIINFLLTRQYLLLQVLGDCRGRRVVDIADRMKLSRAAVSHHIQILKNAGVVKSRKEGSFIYYYIDLDSNCMQSMIDLFTKIQEVMNQIPDRSGEI